MINAEAFGPFLARDHNAAVVLVYSVGTRLVHYLGLDACQLSVLHTDIRDFEQRFKRYDQRTPLDFANTYTSTETRRRMIPISGAAYRVLRAILVGQAPSLEDIPQLQAMENAMASAEHTRRPDGPVAKIHAYLDSRVDKIKAGAVSRKELVDILVGKGFNENTVISQCGAWARTNGVTFARPAAAKEAKKAAVKTSRKKEPVAA